MTKYLLFPLILLVYSCSPKNPVSEILRKDSFLYKIATDTSHEVQILYTSVNLKDTTFRSYSFNVDQTRYFYPASTVKMPVAILALQRIRELNRDGVDLNMKDDMLTAANRPIQTIAVADSTTESGKPNIERYVQKIFAVSDNDAYNRLYELLGQDYINQSLKERGVFKHSVICHRLSVSGYTPEENRHTNHIRFFRDNKIVFDKPAADATENRQHNATNALKGIGYLNANDSLINEPFDFSKKNFYTIPEMEGTIRRIIFPDSFTPEERFDLSNEDYIFLKKCMSELPRSYPFYAKDTVTYYDSYVKFVMIGDRKDRVPEHVKIYNKVGNAYGYLIDCAYIEDSKHQIGFFLTSVVHTNQNKIYNDGIYEYESVGMPFLAKLGREIYNYELRNKK
ncbi:MAG: serine hydrolase [Saprospiraceae bacterium]|nr:serine hydrolase [Saprospiraceae bacterium]